MDLPKQGLDAIPTDSSKSVFEIAHAIRSNLKDHLPARELTRIGRLPIREFKRQFREATGITPYHYLLKVRAAEVAKILLAKPDANLSDVAEKVGFSSVGALKRKFKRDFGVTLEDYLETCRAKATETGGRP